MHRAVSFLLLALACAFTAAAQVTGIHSKPLVSVVLVTCGRPEYLKLALAQIHEQSYPNLEVVLVVDGTPVDLSREPRLHVHPASSFTTPSSTNLLDVRVVQFDHRATVGEKRNAAVLTARGEILVHWDDDDLYDPTRIEAQIAPLLDNTARMSALVYSHAAAHAADGPPQWYSVKKSGAAQVMPASLAYKKSSALALGLFPNVSLGEDIGLIQAGLSSCEQLATVAVPSVYTRHGGHAGNTWQWAEDRSMESHGFGASARPRFVSDVLLQAYMAAEADTSTRGACDVVARELPTFTEHTFPKLPPRCCEGSADPSRCLTKAEVEGRARRRLQYSYAYGEQDPHLHFAHGGRADFRGRDNQIYNFLSAPNLAVNVKTEAASFKLHGGKLTVDGSFMTEAHIVARVGGTKRKWANVSFWASKLNDANWGWRMIGGSCGGHHFNLGPGGVKTCEELSIKVDLSSATFSLGNWTIIARGNAVYDRLSGPTHRLDVDFKSHGDAAARSLPHGIVGQSFSWSSARNGKTDEYPATGYYKTAAMAEGAIQGEAAMYEVLGPYATRFAFSRFDGEEQTVSPASPPVFGDASATD